jgi:hypothetical protein
MKVAPLKYWWTSTEQFPSGLPSETDVESKGIIGVNIREQRSKKNIPSFDFTLSSAMTDAEKSLIRDRDYLVDEFEKAEKKGEKAFEKWKKENRYFYIPSILLPEDPSVKLAKGNKLGYVSYCMYLAPSKESGFANVCSDSSAQCEAGCLNTAGKGGFDYNVIYARYNKTLLFKYHKKWFYEKLYLEIQDIVRKHNSSKNKMYGVPYCIRLNGTSDIPWENIKVFEGKKNIFDCFPSTQFYDYTKVLKRTQFKMPDNYDLTLSRSELQANQKVCAEAIAKGWRIAVVFNRGKEKYHFEIIKGLKQKVSEGFEYDFPKTWHGYKVIDGDETDLRFLDKGGVVVGLSIKGNEQKKADKEDKELFFVSPDADGSFKSSERATIFGIKKDENMRLKKGSKAAKEYMAKIRRMKKSSTDDNISGLERVNKRKTTTYVHYTRTTAKKRATTKTAPKKVARKTAPKKVEKHTTILLSNLHYGDTFTYGKSNTIWERSSKVTNNPNKYWVISLNGQRKGLSGNTRVNLIDEYGVSGFVHKKTHGRKTTLKYTHPVAKKRISGVSTPSKSHTDYNSPEVNIQIGMAHSNMDLIKQHMHSMAMLNEQIAHCRINKKYQSTIEKRATDKHIAYLKKNIASYKKQISELKKHI